MRVVRVVSDPHRNLGTQISIVVFFLYWYGTPPESWVVLPSFSWDRDRRRTTRTTGTIILGWDWMGGYMCRPVPIAGTYEQ